MQPKNLPVIITQDSPARRSYRIEAPDQYAAKYLALFLMDRGINFFFRGFFCDLLEPEICFSVPKTEISAIERCLATLPTARPTSTEHLKPCLFPEAEAGRLDLSESQLAVAQVTGYGNTEYLADLWNAFAPLSKAPVA